MSEDAFRRLTRAIDRLLLPAPVACPVWWSADYRMTYIRVPGRAEPHTVIWQRPFQRAEAHQLRAEWDGRLITLYRADVTTPFQTLLPRDTAA